MVVEALMASASEQARRLGSAAVTTAHVAAMLRPAGAGGAPGAQ
jgi:hypothetical protein